MSGLLSAIWPAGRIRWVLGLVYTVVVAAAVVTLFLLLVMPQLGRSGESTARYFRESAVVYASINLRPGLQQVNRAAEVGRLLRTQDFLDREEDLLETIEDGTRVHPVEDVVPWLGTDVTFALLDVDGDVPEWVLMAQVGDQGGALEFVDELLEWLSHALSTEFDEDEIGDALVWTAVGQPLVIGLSDSYLLLADSENTMGDTLDNIESPPLWSLAKHESFIAAREALPQGRVMFVYAQGEDYLDEVESLTRPWGDAGAAWDLAEGSAPEYVAASLSFVELGVRFDVLSGGGSVSLPGDSAVGLLSPEVVPEDALFFLAYSGVKDGWGEFRDVLEDSDPSVSGHFDQFLEEFEDETGVDLEEDFLESLSGEVALAIMPGGLRISGYGAGVEGVIEALLLAGLEDPRAVQAAMESLVDVVSESGAEVDRASVGGYEAVMVRADQFGLEGYEPGYLITTDWLALGSSLETLESFHDAGEGEAGSLASSERYSALAELAPRPLHFLLYADLAGLLDMVVEGLDRDSWEGYDEAVRPFVENLDAMMVASSLTDETWRLTTVVTFSE